ncbi:MAG: hypothetical protein J6S85_12480 [Methanobrevibacter sp.]|nr:hypothetical protein [Methanobrevibacter sp.]
MADNFETKIGNVLNHLKKYRSITSWEAITLYKATRLSAIIFTLKERGYEFKTIREENEETGTHYARYFLVGSPHNSKIKKSLEEFQSLFYRE